MPWIRTVSPDSATGLLRKIYDTALTRAGRVFRVLEVQSLQPPVLQAAVQLYTRVMTSDREPLTRAQREMIAVTVSRANACEY